MTWQNLNVDWQHEAGELARIAHDMWFPDRRGIVKIRQDVICLYNNNPNGLRPRATELLRARLNAAGITELAYAEYPVHGNDAGYSYAMIIAGNKNLLRRIQMMIYEVEDQAFRELQSRVHEVEDQALREFQSRECRETVDNSQGWQPAGEGTGVVRKIRVQQPPEETRE